MLGFVCRAVCLAALASSFTISAAASPITVTVTGKVTIFDDAGAVTDGSIAVDAPYTLTMVFDAAAAVDRDPDPTLGDYAISAAQSSYVVQVGNYSFSTSGFLVFGVLDGFMAPTEDEFGWLALDVVSSGPLVVPGVTWSSVAWSDSALNDRTGAALTSDSLESTNWNRTAYEPNIRAFYVFAEVLDPRTSSRDFIEFHATIDSMIVSAPEPALLALLAASAALLVARRRPRR